MRCIGAAYLGHAQVVATLLRARRGGGYCLTAAAVNAADKQRRTVLHWAGLGWRGAHALWALGTRWRKRGDHGQVVALLLAEERVGVTPNATGRDTERFAFVRLGAEDRDGDSALGSVAGRGIPPVELLKLLLPRDHRDGSRGTASPSPPAVAPPTTPPPSAVQAAISKLDGTSPPSQSSPQGPAHGVADQGPRRSRRALTPSPCSSTGPSERAAWTISSRSSRSCGVSRWQGRLRSAAGGTRAATSCTLRPWATTRTSSTTFCGTLISWRASRGAGSTSSTVRTTAVPRSSVRWSPEASTTSASCCWTAE
eukprot:jgi/Botrbrau1/719/Bobra.160_2s0042.1